MENEIYRVVTSLLVLSAISVLISFFVSGTSIEKSIKVLFSVTALSIVLSLFSPVISFILNFDEITTESTDNTDEGLNEMITAKETTKQIALNVRKMLSLRLGLDEDELIVSVTVDKNEDGEYYLKNVTVTLSKDHEGLYDTVINLVESELLCDCIIISE